MREKLKRWHHINWAEHVNDKDGAGNLRQQLFETPWVERELERRLEQDRRESAARGLGRCEVSSRPAPAAAATRSTPSRRARRVWSVCRVAVSPLVRASRALVSAFAPRVVCVVF